MMKKVIVAVLVPVLLSALSLFGGCSTDPRVAVVATKVMTTVDSLIGDLEVQRETVRQAISTAREETQRLRASEIKSAVQAEHLEVQIGDLVASRETAGAHLLSLADMVEIGEPVELSDGTTMSAADLRAYAAGRTEAYQLLGERIATYEQAMAELRQAEAEARSLAIEGEAATARLEARLELLDAKQFRLQMLRGASGQPALEGGAPDAVATAEAIMDEALLDTDNETEVITRMREHRELEVVLDEAQLEIDLADAADQAESIRETVGGEG